MYDCPGVHVVTVLVGSLWKEILDVVWEIVPSNLTKLALLSIVTVCDCVMVLLLPKYLMPLW